MGAVGVNKLVASANHSSEKARIFPPRAAEIKSEGEDQCLFLCHDKAVLCVYEAGLTMRRLTHYLPMLLERKVVSMSSEATLEALTCSRVYSCSLAMMKVEMRGIERIEEGQTVALGAGFEFHQDMSSVRISRWIVSRLGVCKM